MTEPLPQTRPVTFMGTPVGGVGPGGRLQSRSFFEAAQAEWDFTVENIVKSRWRMLAEGPGDQISLEQFKEIVGDSDVPFEPGITANEAERRLAFHEHAKSEAQYEGNILATLVGGGLPMLADPVTVATLPFGAGAGLRAAEAFGARAWGRFLGQSALGGAQAGVASLPFEYGFQRAETGAVRPGELAGTVLGPIVLSPILSGAAGAAGAAFRRIKNGPRATSITRNGATNPEVPPDVAADAIDKATRDNIMPPPKAKRTVDVPAPTQRLTEMFAEYPGGHRAWVRDLAAQRDEARDFARAAGMDPDDPVLERMLDQLGRESDQRSATPPDYNIRLLDTFNRFRAGEAMDAADMRLLTDNGLALPRKRLAGEAVEGVVDDAGGAVLAQTAAGRRLAEALDNPKSVPNAKLLRRVNRDGTAAVRNELEQGEGVPATLGRVIDDEFDDAQVIRALDGVRRTAPPEGTPPRGGRDPLDVVMDPRFDDVIDPLRLASLALRDPDRAGELLQELREALAAAEQYLRKKYGLKRHEAFDDAPLTKREEDFLFFGDRAIDSEAIRAREAVLVEPIDRDDLVTELRWAANRLPDTARFEDMDEAGQLAAARLMFLSDRAERMGEDAMQLIKDAVREHATRVADPDDIELLARDMLERLVRFMDGPPPEAASPSPPAAARIEQNVEMPPPQRLEPPAGDGTVTRRMALEADVEQWARAAGVEVDDVLAVVDEAMEKAISCGRRPG